MRVLNAIPLVRYETEGNVRVYWETDENRLEAATLEGCALIRYDASVVRWTPLTVEWPEAAQRRLGR